MIQSPTSEADIPTYRLLSRFYIVGKPNPLGKRYYSSKIEGIACADYPSASSFLKKIKRGK